MPPGKWHERLVKGHFLQFNAGFEEDFSRFFKSLGKIGNKELVVRFGPGMAKLFFIQYIAKFLSYNLRTIIELDLTIVVGFNFFFYQWIMRACKH